MNNLQMILNFIGEHPFISFLIIWSIFSWTPIKIIHNYNKYEEDKK